MATDERNYGELTQISIFDSNFEKQFENRNLRTFKASKNLNFIFFITNDRYRAFRNCKFDTCSLNHERAKKVYFSKKLVECKQK